MFNKGLIPINPVAVFILGRHKNLVLEQNCLFIKFNIDYPCKYEEVVFGEESRQVDLRIKKMLYENGLKSAIERFICL